MFILKLTPTAPIFEPNIVFSSFTIESKIAWPFLGTTLASLKLCNLRKETFVRIYR